MQEATNVARYVQYRDDNWYVGDSRVELYSVIAAWQQGFSPEEVQASFPVLTRLEVYGTILYYLEHQAEMDRFFREADEVGEQQRSAAEAEHIEFYAQMRERIARHREAEQHGSAAS
jgi:hypothetical protein